MALTPQNNPERDSIFEETGNGIELAISLCASAGGLEALEEFFSDLPEAEGLAFVVQMFRDSRQESGLGRILQSKTSLPVKEVTRSLELKAGTVYLLPAGKAGEFADGKLRISKSDGNSGAHYDAIFHSLAMAYRERAVGLIFSGTGSDGLVGAGAIKEQGGLVMVQAPAEARFDDISRAVIDAGFADFTLAAREMGPKLITFRDATRRTRSQSAVEVGTDSVRSIKQILIYLRMRTGHDFTHYKRSTVLRRIARRMAIAGSLDFEEYRSFLRDNSEEPRALLKDLLISVTSFFRDRNEFTVLEEVVVSKLFEGKGVADEIRVWVPGCATGEEAYSIAMLLTEHASRLSKPPTIQVFATDLNTNAIKTAREGIYPEALLADVSEERRERFFNVHGGRFRVKQPLREMILFAPHSLLKDPPFSRIDCISCRNLLIYMQKELQQKVLGLFHYALRPNGYLFIGTSESTNNASSLFRTVNKSAHIFQKLDVEGHLPELPISPTPPAVYPAESQEAQTAGLDSELKGHAAVLERLQAQSAPPGLLVNLNHDLVRLTDSATVYLRHTGGAPTQNILKLINPELRSPLQTTLYSARRQEKEAESRPSKFGVAGEEKFVRIRVRPVEEAQCFHVVFEEIPMKMDLSDASGRDGAANLLQEELQETKEQLQQIVEEYETSREELKAQNEELQSINEELRSTAEELESSKEEAQSVAEELQMVNSELSNRVEETLQARDDIENLMIATEIPMVFLDRSLKIQRFTPSSSRLFKILESDVGRPLEDLAARFDYPSLHKDAQTVLKTLETVQKEIRAEGDTWYLVRVRPYKTADNRIEGIVFTFLDITEQKRLQEELLEAKSDAEKIITAMPEPLLVLNPDLSVQSANEAFYVHFQVQKEDTEGRKIYDLGNREWNIPQLKTLLQEVLPGNDSFFNFEVTNDFSLLGRRTMLLSGRRLDDIRCILLAIEDITEQKNVEGALRGFIEELKMHVNERTAQVRELMKALTLAEQEERHRIARLLHDDLQQYLYGLSMTLSLLRKSPSQEAHRLRDQADNILQHATRLTRTLSTELSPPIIQSEDLEESLKWLAERKKALYDLEVDLQIAGPITIAEKNLRVLVYQSIREVLFNVVKHAGVKHVTVEAEKVHGVIYLAIKDGGSGFDPAILKDRRPQKGGFGLSGIRERLDLLGGRMNIETAPGKGTHVSIEIPLDSEVSDPDMDEF